MNKQIFDLIEKSETIIIHRHVRPDPDAYGSQGGLAEILQATYPDKRIFCVGTAESSLDYLFEPDQIEDTCYVGALVIVTDTANTERIDDKRYATGLRMIKIDHHPNRESYGDVMWVEETASSTSEMIYELFLTGQAEYGWVCNEEAARLIFAGIVGDTGRFLFPSTSEKTFRYAAELIGYGFDRTKLYNAMYEEPLGMVQLHGHILKHFETRENGVGKICITKEMRNHYRVSSEDCSRLVSALGEVKGLKAWVLFNEDDPIRVNLRSKGPAINELAAKYNGGGHLLAAGAKVANWAEAEQLTQDLIKICEE